MNQIMSAVPVRGGWCVQLVLPDGTLRWIPCVGSFRASIARAARWRPEEGEGK